MGRDILAIGVWDSFLSKLTPLIQTRGSRILSSPTLSAASRLLTQKDFSLVLIDLHCFIGCTYAFAQEIRCRSLPSILLGTSGITYNWRVEQEVDRFYSYKTSVNQIVEEIELLISRYALGLM